MKSRRSFFSDNRHRMWRACAICFLLECLSLGHSATPAAAEQQVAILIGVEGYRHAPKLEYTINDVEQLAQTLRERCGFSVISFLETQPDEDSQPLRTNLLSRLPDLLNKIGSRDTLLLYFTGHGFRNRDGKLYLAPLDCDPKNAAATGISVQWLRDQMSKCRARVKLLVLDACHAGSSRTASGVRSVASRDLAVEFEKSPGIVTLASCTGEEYSLIWSEKKQSLFSYWLNQGLRGNADFERKGEVTIDDLYRYLAGTVDKPGNVQRIAKNHFNSKQTPARIIGPDVIGVPVVVRPKPYTLKVVLREMAENLATQMQLEGVKRVGVVGFTTADASGANYGPLARLCADELASCLVERSAGQFVVMEPDALQASFRAEGLTVQDMNTQRARSVVAKGDGMAALAQGSLSGRKGREVMLSCKLVQADGQYLPGQTAALVLLNEDEWAMFGHSAQLRPEDRQATQDRELPGKPGSQIPKLEPQTSDSHPQSPGNTPNFPLRIAVERRERQAKFNGNKMSVPLRQGEVYEIWVKNTTPKPVMMRLLVDGLNTLPEPVRVKAMVVEAKERLPAYRYLPAQRVNMSEAQAWLLHPGQEYTVRGFYSKTGKDVTGRVKIGQR